MAHEQAGAEHHGHHIITRGTLLKVFGTLVIFTILTYLAYLVDLGPLNIPLALAIAAAKVMLVVMFFMGLKYDNPVNTLTFTMGGVFVLIFLVFTLFDTVFRGDLDNTQSGTILDQQRQEELLQEREPASEDLRIAPGDFPAAGPATEGPATEGPATEGPATEGPATEAVPEGEAEVEAGAEQP